MDEFTTSESSLVEDLNDSPLPHDQGSDGISSVATFEKNLIIAKIVAMLVLGIVSFGLGILPVKLASWLHWNKDTGINNSIVKRSAQQFVISLLLCFGGGVLLFTTFLHLQPEVREGFEFLESGGQVPEMGHGLHLAELVFCAGFFFVYLVEELVHSVMDRRPHEHEDEAVLHRTMSLRRCSRHPTHGSENCDGATMIPRVSLGNQASVKKGGDGMENGNNESAGSSISASTQGLLNTSSSLSTIVVSDHTKQSPLDAETHMTGGPLVTFKNNPHHHHHHHHHHHGHGHSHAIPFKDDDDSSTSNTTVAQSFRGFLAVVALSFHAVFEGLAVGLEASVSNVWYLFAAIATHKFVIAFCVGVELVSSRTRMVLIFVYVATFAAVTPLGIGVGIALSGADASTSTVATVVLQGMAAGTLLYVVFFEVLQRERANTQSGFWQLIAIMLGFGVMFALQIAIGHEHEHGHSHSHVVAGANSLDNNGHDHDHDHDHDHAAHDHDHIAETISNVTQLLSNAITEAVTPHNH